MASSMGIFLEMGFPPRRGRLSTVLDIGCLPDNPALVEARVCVAWGFLGVRAGGLPLGTKTGFAGTSYVGMETAWTR